MMHPITKLGKYNDITHLIKKYVVIESLNRNDIWSYSPTSLKPLPHLKDCPRMLKTRR